MCPAVKSKIVGKLLAIHLQYEASVPVPAEPFATAETFGLPPGAMKLGLMGGRF
jgi:hypothetical protein